MTQGKLFVQPPKYPVIYASTQSTKYDKHMESAKPQSVKPVDPQLFKCDNNKPLKSVNIQLSKCDYMQSVSTQSVKCDNVQPVNSVSTQSVKCDNMQPVNSVSTQSVKCDNMQLVNSVSTQSVKCDNMQPVNSVNTQPVKCDTTQSEKICKYPISKTCNLQSVKSFNTQSVKSVKSVINQSNITYAAQTQENVVGSNTKQFSEITNLVGSRNMGSATNQNINSSVTPGNQTPVTNDIPSTTDICLGCLNVCGLKRRVQYPEFCTLVNQHDILCVAETKLDDTDVILVDNYTFYNKPRRQSYIRKSGGLGFLVSNSISNHMKQVQTDSEYIYCLSLSKQAHHFDQDILIMAVYVPPEQSRFYNKDEFELFENDITRLCGQYDYIITMGDFNAQTGELVDYTSDDSFFTVFFDLDQDTVEFYNQKSVLERLRVNLQR